MEAQSVDLSPPVHGAMTRPPAQPSDQVPADLRFTFATNVKAARLEAGLSIRELSKLAGVATSYVFEIEHGTANVTLDRLTQIARALGKEPNDLLTPTKPSSQLRKK
jgi:ribosome-binding protein aMBF1 (putative translation factor)